MSSPNVEPSWAGWVTACVAVLALFGAAFEWFRRRVRTMIKASGLAIGDRLTVLQYNIDKRADDLTIDIEAVDKSAKAARLELKSDVDVRMMNLEARTEATFNVVHRRLDDMSSTMARREDMARVEGKIDQLLMQRQRD